MNRWYFLPAAWLDRSWNQSNLSMNSLCYKTDCISTSPDINATNRTIVEFVSYGYTCSISGTPTCLHNILITRLLRGDQYHNSPIPVLSLCTFLESFSRCDFIIYQASFKAVIAPMHLPTPLYCKLFVLKSDLYQHRWWFIYIVYLNLFI